MWNKFIEAGYVKPIDLQLAKQLSCHASLSPSLHAFLVHLSISMRRGHVCVDQSTEIRPIWELVESHPTSTQEALQQGLMENDWIEMETLIRKGFNEIPSHLSQTPNNETPLNLNPIVIQGSKVYTQRSWLAEALFKKHLSNFLERAETDSCAISTAEIAAKITAYGLENTLMKEQKDAILQSTAPLSLIAGGPGTGKTYTAGWMISILTELLEEKLGRPAAIALAAPTGKAALHLENSVQKRDASHKRCTGLTLHTLLSRLPLQADLIIVDEASMIDLEWMNKLLKEIPKGSRLILIGDPNQLPPVGMGSVFVDMIQTMPHTALTQCLRTDLHTIVEYANSIKNGNFVPWEMTFSLQDEEALIKHCLQNYKKCVTLNDFAHFKILTPFTKGTFGTEQLNQKILNRLGKPESIPILITKNDYELELFNGEQGLWIPARGIVQFPKKGGEGIRELPLSLIGSYQLAYCLTIHKSQGSEYAHVVVIYPEGAQIFGREALYTAVTRTKQTLEIYAGPNVLQQSVQRSSRKLSGIY
jgi:exodeoxyribonuclease V alpha subunit